MSAEGTLPKFVKNYSVVTRSVKQMRIPAGVVKMQSTLSLHSSYANLEWLEAVIWTLHQRHCNRQRKKSLLTLGNILSGNVVVVFGYLRLLALLQMFHQLLNQVCYWAVPCLRCFLAARNMVREGC